MSLITVVILQIDLKSGNDPFAVRINWGYQIGLACGGPRGFSGATSMDSKNGIDCPRIFASQLEDMIAYADAKQDFALAAWLSQALDRLMGSQADT
jgi:hypothetical protein